MEVRRYRPEDFHQIYEWAKSYNADYEESQFPETGFIVDGCAAYFIYQTDSSVCFLENMISNKNANALDRETAIEMIIDAVLKEASELGFKVAYATTGIAAVAARASKHGAKIELQQFLLTKKLTGPT